MFGSNMNISRQSKILLMGLFVFVLPFLISIVMAGKNEDGFESPEFNEIFNGWSEEQKKQFRILIKDADSVTRKNLIANIVEEKKEALTVQTVFLRLVPGKAELEIPDDQKLRLLFTEQEKALLKTFNLKGKIQFGQNGTHGTGKRVKIVCVLQEQVKEAFTFAVPQDKTIFCIQTKDGALEIFPRDYEKSKKSLSLTPMEEKITWVELNDRGGISSWTVYDWSQQAEQSAGSNPEGASPRSK
jgi:hypothetical protein